MRRKLLPGLQPVRLRCGFAVIQTDRRCEGADRATVTKERKIRCTTRQKITTVRGEIARYTLGARRKLERVRAGTSAG